MEYYFNKVLTAIHQETCYSQYAGYELTIIQAITKYNSWLAHSEDPDLGPIYLQTFMDECADASCDDATAALIGSLTGNSGLFGCDMLQILYAGDVEGGYFVGWRDQVANKAAYLLSLANMGVVVQSAFLTLETNSTEAWRVVQDQFGADLLAAGKRVKQFDTKCLTEFEANGETNSSRILQEHASQGLDN